MTHVSDESLLEHLGWRYACKKFAPHLKIPPLQWRTIEEGFRQSPSSYGIQPWHFVVVSDPVIKATLPEISWGQRQPADCSHVVVVCVRRDYTEADVAHFVDRTAAVRGQPLESLAGFRKTLVGGAANQPEDEKARYLERQVYIALGFGLYTAMMLGIDAAPMEGIDADQYDKKFKLADLGYRSLCIACFGYRDETDPYAKKAKVRFDRGDVLTHYPPEE